MIEKSIKKTEEINKDIERTIIKKATGLSRWLFIITV